ncbi:MAG: hypothetical protein ABIB71_03875 [Candidatus Woesearchaeota archaeon]
MLELVWVVAGVIAVSVIVYYAVSHRSKKLLYGRARRLHKRGEKYYTLGDRELAEEYYREAEGLREKAGRLK